MYWIKKSLFVMIRSKKGYLMETLELLIGKLFIMFLLKANIRSMFTQIEFYRISLVRLLLIPAISLLLLCLIPNIFIDVKMSLFLAVACPVGSNVAVYAQLHDKNYIYAVQTVVLSTLLSMVTIPLWVIIIQYLW